MEPITLLKIVRQRVPWTTIKPALAELQLPLGHGWDGTIINIIEAFTYKPNLASATIPPIKSKFEEHLFCGEKLLKLYDVDEVVCNDLIKAFSEIDIPESTFKESYPFPLSEEQLSEQQGSIELVNVIQEKQRIKLLFASSQYYEEQVTLHSNDLKEDVVSEFGLQDQTEIVAKRKKFRQFYDVFVIDPAQKIIELRFDWGVGMNTKDAKAAIIKLIRKFNELCSEQLGCAFQLGDPINVFPLVRKLYNDDTVGRVCELGFTVNSGSVKQEKLRRFNTDIRTEEFHKGGKEAVDGQLDPYRLAIDWSEMESLKLETRPELVLKGTQRCLSKPSEHKLTDSLILNCYTQQEFDFIVDILLCNLKDNDTESKK